MPGSLGIQLWLKPFVCSTHQPSNTSLMSGYVAGGKHWRKGAFQVEETVGTEG